MADCSHNTITLTHRLTSIRVRGDARAEAQRESELSAAYQRGYETAMAELQASRAAERAELAGLQEETLKHLAASEQTLRDEMEAALPDLILEGVRRVLPEIEIDAPLIDKTIRGLLDGQVQDEGKFVVFLSSHDCELMETLRAESPSKYPRIEFKADATFQPGDCLVQSRFGTTDARIETKLKNLREALS